MDHHGADDDRDIRKGVAEVVDQNAAQVEVAAAAHKRESDAAVHRERCEGRPDHPALDDVYGSAQTLDGFVTKPQRKNDENDGIGECGEDSGAMIAVSLLGVGGTLGP